MKSRDAKRERYFYGSSSKSRLEIQDKTRFKKTVSNNVPSRFPKTRDDKVSYPKPKRERVLVHQPRSQLVESVGRIIMVIPSL